MTSCSGQRAQKVVEAMGETDRKLEEGYARQKVGNEHEGEASSWDVGISCSLVVGLQSRQQ